MTDFSALRSTVSGPVLEPTDEGFAEELLGFNLADTHTPNLVVGATDAADIVATVRFASDNGLHVRVMATGHGSHAAIQDGIVITTKRMLSVTVDPQASTATIGAGVPWGLVVSAAADAGLAPITGSSPTVGAIGYLLGGGAGPLARSHGMSSDYVRGFSVVTGAGQLVEASASVNPDLFWALRGGKAGLGVVTEATIALVAIPELYAGSIMFPTPAIEPVLRAWVDFTATAPADVTTSVAIMRFPPIEQVPPPLRGQTLLALRFAFPGSAEEGERIIAPLRAAGPAMMDAVGPLDPRNVAMIHNDPTDPMPATTSGGLIQSVDQDFVSAVLAVAGPDLQVPLVAIELRHIGSSTSTDVEGGSSTGGRSSDFLYNIVAALMQPGIAPAVGAATAAVIAAMGPWLSSSTFVNFAGHPHDTADFARSWTPEAFTRLESVRATTDPNKIFSYGLSE